MVSLVSQSKADFLLWKNNSSAFEQKVNLLNDSLGLKGHSSLVSTETKIIFLLPTGRPYVNKLMEKFISASFVRWKCFRLDIHEAEQCEKKTSP
jgi:hypothetical protein